MLRPLSRSLHRTRKRYVDVAALDAALKMQKWHVCFQSNEQELPDWRPRRKGTLTDVENARGLTAFANCTKRTGAVELPSSGLPQRMQEGEMYVVEGLETPEDEPRLAEGEGDRQRRIDAGQAIPQIKS